MDHSRTTKEWVVAHHPKLALIFPEIDGAGKAKTKQALLKPLSKKLPAKATGLIVCYSMSL